MQSPNLRSRLIGYLQRTTTKSIWRRPISIHPQRPFISFTFDDFPRSALLSRRRRPEPPRPCRDLLRFTRVSRKGNSKRPNVPYRRI